MTTLTRRHDNPVAEVLSWLDNDAPFALRTDGTPLVRIEDYVEDGTYVLRAEGWHSGSTRRRTSRSPSPVTP